MNFFKYYRLFVLVHFSAFVLVTIGWCLLDGTETTETVFQYVGEMFTTGLAAMLLGSLLPALIISKIAERRIVTVLQFVSTSLLIILFQANAYTIFSEGEMITQHLLTTLQNKEWERFNYLLVLHAAIFVPLVIAAFFQPKTIIKRKTTAAVEQSNQQ